MAQFKYGDPLEEGQIRLLRLSLGKQDEILRGNLVTRRLVVDQVETDESTGAIEVTRAEGAAPRAEPYEALSYHWGHKTAEERTIMLAVGDGEKVEYKPFNIRINLESALRLLRSQIPFDIWPATSRFIWVDALCINQNDSEEKSVQIPLMAEIYARASQVCVWLGDAKDNSDTAIEFVESVIKLDEFDDLLNRNPVQWKAFFDLLKRPWFSRRWIIQEIALARTATLYCGNKAVSWQKFADAVSLFSSRNESLRKLFKKSPEDSNHPNMVGDIEKLGASWLASKINTLFRKTHTGTILEHMFSLEALMSNLTLFEAGEPRDTLYAILWLANDVRPEGAALTEYRVHHSRPPSPELKYADAPKSSIPTLDTMSPVPMTESAKKSSSNDTVGVQEDLQTPLPNSGLLAGEDVTKITGEPTAIRVPHDRAKRTEEYSSSRGRERESPRTENGRQSKYGSQLTPGEPAPREGSNDRSAGDTPLGVRNIFFNGTNRNIRIKYDKTVYEVCKDFLSHVFSRFGHIDMMCRPWAPEGTSEHPFKPPSWMVPLKNNVAFKLDHNKVYRRVRADLLVGSPEKHRRNYNASGQSRAWRDKRDSWNPNPYIPKIGDNLNLFLTGVELAEIDHTEDPASVGNIPHEWLSHFGEKGWDPADGSRPPPEFWRLLVADRDLDEISEPPRYFDMACRWAFNRGVKGEHLDTSAILEHEDCPSHVGEFLRRVQRVVWHRRLVIGVCPKPTVDTEPLPPPVAEDLLCLAPHGVKVGDIICILNGCSVPVILRPEQSETAQATVSSTVRTARVQARPRMQDSSVPHLSNSELKGSKSEVKTWYRFIGECYVHGMMNGEVFSHCKKFYGDWMNRETTFEIR